jgi:hypothetical protein
MSENDEYSLWDAALDDPPEPAPIDRGPLVEGAIVVFGLIALVCPLALWIAWTETILLSVLAVGLFSIAACYLLVSVGRKSGNSINN